MRASGARRISLSGVCRALIFCVTFLPAMALHAEGSDLLAHWKLDEGAGTLAGDSSGTGHDATLVNGPSWTLGVQGQALGFDGINDYASVGSFEFNPSSAMTVSLWVNPVGAGSGFQTVLAKGEYVYPFRVRLRKSDNRIETTVRTANGTNYLFTNRAVTPGTWYHIAMTYRSGARVVYVDGAEDNANSPAGGLSTIASPLTIGANSAQSGFFCGAVDDIRLYTRALTSAEIQALYQSGIQADGDPPTVPQHLVAAEVAVTRITLAWDASIDNISVTGYRVFRDGAIIATTLGTTCRDIGLSPSTLYSYQVLAFDDAGNESRRSEELSVRTQDPVSHCVRADAGPNGDGSSWEKAWRALPANLVRGHAYYIADGAYPSYVFDDPPSGEAFIYIKKATQTDHGADTGWDSSYGDGVAVFSAPGGGDILSILTSYYEINGQTGGRPDTSSDASLSDGSWANAWTSGHGFKVQGNLSNVPVALGYSTSHAVKRPDHITLKHMDIGGFSVTDYTDRGICQYGSPEEGLGSKYVHISHCYVHDTENVLLFGMYGQYWVIEYNYFCRNHTSPVNHSNGFADRGSDDVIIRYNIWADIEGTGHITLKKNESQVHENWQIYGNIFFASYGNPYDKVGVGGAGPIGSTSCGIRDCSTVVFHDNGEAADTITDSNNGFIPNPPEAGVVFDAGRKILVQGSLHNDGFYTIAGVTTDTLTLSPGDTLVNEPAGAIVNVTTGYTRNVKIYSNTFVNIKGENSGILMYAAVDCEAYNNLWYNCDWAGTTGVKADYNTYVNTRIRYGSFLQLNDTMSKGDPFVDWKLGDVRLKGATLPGCPLSGSYGMDLFGKPRGKDGVWDRGAIEYYRLETSVGNVWGLYP